MFKSHAGVALHAVDHGGGDRSTTKPLLLDDFKARFSDLHQKLCSELAAGCVDTLCILRNLSLLPLELKKEYDKPIKELLPELKQQTNISHLLYQLNPLLSFIDYSLLEHIINQLGSEGLKKEIVVYCRDIQTFMKKTTVRQLIGYLPGELEVPPNFEVLIAKVKEDASKCTLARIDDFRRQLFAEIRLSEIVCHLLALEDSNSFLLSFLVPSVLVSGIIKSARKIDNCFFHRESIAYTLVGNRWVYHPNLLLFGTPEQYYHKGEWLDTIHGIVVRLNTNKVS